MIALDDELEWVSERRGTLQHDRLATYDTELQESAPRRWSTADSQDPAGLTSAELIQAHDRRCCRAELAASPGGRTTHRDDASQPLAGAVFAILIWQVGFHET